MEDFWNTLCVELDYRLITGTVFDELSFVFNTMSSDILHFIPTINSEIAVNIANGVVFCGNKACLIINSEDLNEVVFNKKNIILPMLIITDTINKVSNIKSFDYSGVETVCLSHDYIKIENCPAVISLNDKLIIGE